MRVTAFAALFLVCNYTVADQTGCDDFSTLAHNIMEARQSGVPMKATMGVAEDSGMSDSLKKLIRNMVISAYEKPRFSTEKMQAREISEFENEYYLACVKSLL